MSMAKPVIQILLLTAIAGVAQAQAITPASVVDTYADIAQAGYEDSLSTAKKLKDAVTQLTQEPSEQSLNNARVAWFAARAPYQQTEVYRFGNPLVDDWEGKVNAWPLDEGLIDYVDASYGSESDENDFYSANIIANDFVTINGQQVDASNITPSLLSSKLHEAGGIETNVATGYHAIEFLLWGQDLNGGNAGAGARLHTDYNVNNCTQQNCERRAQYLTAATDLLVLDLEYMASAWADDGEARGALDAMGEDGALAAMLIGMGSLSYGELAGERMQLGLMLHDPEEEHDCFSDNTSTSHYYDGLGIQNVFLGKYQRVDGSSVSGPSLVDLVNQKDAALAAELSADLQSSVDALNVMVVSQNNDKAYDQLIAEGNTEGNAMVQTAIDALVGQTRNIERVVALLGVSGVNIEGSDSLDDPSSVFQ
ncbi:MAG: putative iron-regulated protein [Gammaproteobacteria bacterium]|jgi:putative iron-regulated protein